MGNLKAKRMGEVSWYVIAGSHNGYRFSLPEKYGGGSMEGSYARFNGTLNQARAFCKKLIEENHKRYHDNYDMYSDAVFYSPLDWCRIAKGMRIPKEDADFLKSCGERISHGNTSRGYEHILLDEVSGGVVSLERWKDGKYEVRWEPNSQRGNSYRIAPNGSLMR